MTALACTPVSWRARCPKSISFSGCPMAQPAGPFALPASWPPFVPATAYPRWIAFANDEVGIVPAQPPLPLCIYLPFQLADGSQTSSLISESVVGRAMAFTIQRAGTLIGGAFPDL